MRPCHGARTSRPSGLGVSLPSISSVTSLIVIGAPTGQPFFLYTALILSKLNYGAAVYASGAPRFLAILIRFRTRPSA